MSATAASTDGEILSIMVQVLSSATRVDTVR
jgi:hypothetical protein